MNIEFNSETIKSIFQKGYTTKTSCSFEEIEKEFHRIQSPYSDVIFEGISVQFTFESFEKKNNLDLWKDYNRYFSLNFAKQNHIGLGWAFGELGLNPVDYINEIDPEWRWRVWDGYGYFTGTLKRRTVLRKVSFSNEISEEWVPAYVQGFGRSLWYTTKGNLEKATKIIEVFPPQDQEHLWRGLEIAIAYVGGLSEEDWKKIMQLEVLEKLKTGFILAYPFLKNKMTKEIMLHFFQLNDKMDCNEIILKKISKDGTNYLEIIKETIS